MIWQLRHPRVFSVVLSVLLLSFFLPGGTSASSSRPPSDADVSPPLVIGHYTLVKKERVPVRKHSDRKVYLYTLRAEIDNRGPGVSSVIATLEGLNPRLSKKIVVIDANLTFGAVPSGGRATSEDTFSIQTDEDHYEDIACKQSEDDDDLSVEKHRRTGLKKSLKADESRKEDDDDDDDRHCVLTWSIQATLANLAPVLDPIGPRAVDEGTTLSFVVSGTDPMGKPLAFSAAGLPVGAVFDTVTRSFTWTPNYNQAASYAVTFTVTDGTLSVSEVVPLTVNPVNRPPMLDLIPEQNGPEGALLTFQISGSDPDGDPLTFAAGILPGGALFDAASRTFAWTPDFNQAGPYAIAFSVSDGSLTAQKTVPIAVTETNRPPRITTTQLNDATDQTAYAFPIAVVDPDHDPLAYRLTQAPDGMAIDPVSGLLSWTPTIVQVGLHSLSVAVDDGRGGRDTRSVPITVVASSDRVPPIVTLDAPVQVLAGESFHMTAQASDNTGVDRVRFFVDGLKIGEILAVPYQFDYTAPAEAGAVLNLRAVASDAAGNTGESTAIVAVVAMPDTTPPVIQSLILPATASPGEMVVVRAEVSDDRGISEVRFLQGGQVVGRVLAAPYEATVTMPASAVAGIQVIVDVQAVDTSANTAGAQGPITVVAGADTAAPFPVTVSVPPDAFAGQTIPVHAAAVDDTGILKVQFLADGVLFAEDSLPPYAADYTVDVTTPQGSQVLFQSRAYDFSGHQTDSALASLHIVAPGIGFIIGEVYDDSRGLPLSGVRVQLVQEGGRKVDPPRVIAADGRGQYRLQSMEGRAVVAIDAAGFTSVQREVEVLPDSVNVAFDTRLTPRGAAVTVEPASGGSLSLADPSAVLTIPAGGLTAAENLTVTALTGQSLPGILPAAWSPVAAVEIAPIGISTLDPMTLTFLGMTDPVLVGVIWDPAGGLWRRVETIVQSAGIELTLSGTGTVALLRPDIQPVAPVIPAVGAPLTGVAITPLPVDGTAVILPSPDVLFMHPEAHSKAEVVLHTAVPSSSGTPVVVDFSENYLLTDGGRSQPEPMSQDLILYQTRTGFSGNLIASPSQIFDPALLQEGVIHLEARGPDGPAGQAVIGSGGGTVATANGISLSIPPGALGTNTPVSLSLFTAQDPALIDTRFQIIAGVQVDFGGAVLAAPAALTIPFDPAAPAGAQVLAIRPVAIDGATRYELIGVAGANATTWTVTAGGLGLPLPGIREAGRYHLIRMIEPVAFLTGAVQSNGVPPVKALIENDRLQFIRIVDAAASHYALAAPLGPLNATGTDLTDGSTGTGATLLNTRNEIAQLDLSLTSMRPAVVSVIPSDGATSVSLTAPVMLRFSRPMDAASVDAVSFLLESSGARAAGSVNLSPDGRAATFQPTQALTSNTLYTVTLTGFLRDSFGNSLQGNQTDGSFRVAFTTVDTTPPPRPAAGQISMSIPLDGLTTVTGTQGSIPTDAALVAQNLTQNTRTVVPASPDGSFSLTLGADPSDAISLFILGASGALTPIDPIPFSDGRGTYVLGPRGGTVKTAGGIQVGVLPSAFVRAGEVSIVDLPLAQAALGLPSGLSPVAAFGIRMPDGLFNRAMKVDLLEQGGQFTDKSVFADPLRVTESLVAPDTVGPASHFGFSARVTDALGVEQSVVIGARGNTVPCQEPGIATLEDRAPRLRLNAPACLGPMQAFVWSAQAIQPRFDVAVSVPAGDPSGAEYVLVRKVTAGVSELWRVEELAAVENRPGESVVATGSRTPLGVWQSGVYVLARVDVPMAFVEGANVGADALLITDLRDAPSLAGLAAAPAGVGGSFLLPVVSGQPLVIHRISPIDGGDLSTHPMAALSPGQTQVLGRIGGQGLPPLTVHVDSGANHVLSWKSGMLFQFSEPVAATSVSPASVIVADATGRAVSGNRILYGDGSILAVEPHRPWHFGETYTYQITTDVVGVSGADLVSNLSGSETAYQPVPLAAIPGKDVTDTVVSDTLAYVVDGDRLRTLDLTEPGLPLERPTQTLRPTPSGMDLDPAGPATGLWFVGGTTAEYGTLERRTINLSGNPDLTGSRKLTTPTGAPALPGIPTQPGEPNALALLGDSVVVASRGVGLQRVPITDLTVPSPDLPVVLPEGNNGLVDIASLGKTLVSISAAGLQVHDPLTLLPLAVAPIDGTPFDVEMASIGGRTLVLVVAGLSGGAQVFALDSSDAGSTVTRVAKIQPGCQVTRVEIDAPMQRAWLACPGLRLIGLDLSDVDGLLPIDANNDGSDDRIAGVLVQNLPLADLDLDRPRSLALISAHGDGLAIAQLGPVEARLIDVIRDPITGTYEDERSILDTGRSYFGDDEIRLIVETRIPPGQTGTSGVKAILDGDAPVLFGNGGLEVSLSAGTNVLRLVPTVRTGNAPTRFHVRVADGTTLMAGFSGTVEPLPPLQDLVSVDASDLTIRDGNPVPVAILGTSADGTIYNLSPMTNFDVLDPALGDIGPDGRFTPSGGGTTTVNLQIAGHDLTFTVSSTLPPVVTDLELTPVEHRFRSLGEAFPLTVTGLLTDETRRPVAPVAEGVIFSTSDPAIATVSTDGIVTAHAPGEVEIRAGIGSARALVRWEVDPFVPPDLTEIRFDQASYSVFTDDPSLIARAVVVGSGTLDGIPVQFSFTTAAGTVMVVASSDRAQSAYFRADGFNQGGQGILTATVIDPKDGVTLTISAQVVIADRNRDAESNDTASGAAAMTISQSIAGTLGGGDAVDVYRVDLEFTGTFRMGIQAVTGEIAARLEDAAGALLSSATASAGAPALLEGQVVGGPLFVYLSAAGDASYTLESDLEQAVPVITAIDPPSASAGSMVTIRGSGFSTRPGRNTVQFDGVLTDVVTATSTELQVVVPAYATDGSVIVWVQSKASNAHPFATGEMVPWNTLAVAPPAETYVFEWDPVFGIEIVRDRLRVAFTPGTTRARVDTIALQLGATIIGVSPRLNIYTIAFPVSPGLAGLHQRLDQLRARADVGYVLPIQLVEPAAFPIAGRDDFPGIILGPVNGRTDPRVSSAWRQIRAPEAWQMIADSGRFSKETDFHTVHVGVIDQGVQVNVTGPKVTSVARPQFDGAIFSGAFTARYAANHPSWDTDVHGLHVAALIGARNVDDSRKRMTGILGGVLPAGAARSFYDVQVFDVGERLNPSCVGTCGYNFDDTLQETLENSPAGAIDVMNLSWGSLKEDPLTALDPVTQANLQQLIDDEKRNYKNLMKIHPEILFVIAAGNNNADARLHGPAFMSRDPDVGDRVITVGNVETGWRFRDPFNNALPDYRASSSNFGDTLDIAAPGRSVLSVNTPATSVENNCITQLLPTDNDWDLFCGTSAAAPMVAGTAALLKALDGTLTAQEIKKLLVYTATEIPVGVWGTWARPLRLDVAAAVQATLARRGNGGTVGAYTVPRTEDGTTPYNPGRKRYLWVPSVPAVAANGGEVISRIQIPLGFESTLLNAVETPPIPLNPPGSPPLCQRPVAIQPALSGDKLYVACRESQSILVWNANTNSPALFDFSGLLGAGLSARISLPFPLPPFSAITMGLSPDGTTLAVPLEGRRVAFIDTRSDRLRVLETRRFALSPINGELRALAFGHGNGLRSTLYAQTDGKTPVLVRVHSELNLPVWKINLLSNIKFRTSPGIAPKGLVISDDPNGYVYVVYDGGSQLPLPSSTAVSVHDPETLALVTPNRSAGHDGLVTSNLKGRYPPAPILRAGDHVHPRLPDALLSTGTGGPLAMAIDGNRKRSYLLFRMTGNVGLMDTEPIRHSFQGLFAATKIEGSFFGPRTEMVASLQYDPATGEAGVSGALQLGDRVYVLDHFPDSFDLDQSGELLAAHFWGQFALRFYGTGAMDHAVNQIKFQALPFPHTPLDDAATETLRSDYLRDQQIVARGIAFEPQISVRSPLGGTVQRGELPVYVAIRDEGITRISCDLIDVASPSVSYVKERTFSIIERKIGVSLSPGPDCLFSNVSRGDYRLRVTGFKGDAVDAAQAVAEVPFRQDGP